MDNERSSKSKVKKSKAPFKRPDNSPSRKLPTLPESSMNYREDQYSVDSAYYESETVSRPPSQRYSIKDEFHQYSGRNTPGRSPSPGRRWLNLVDTLREKRKADNTNRIHRHAEINELNEKFRKSQAMLRKLQSEQIPIREKNKVYETKITLLENKLRVTETELRDTEIISSDRIIELEKKLCNTSNNNELLQFQLHKNLQDNNKSLLVENKMLEKEIVSLNERITLLTKEDEDDDDDVRTKQLANLKSELMKIRQLLEESEKERLNERKEKLSAVQSMVRLTKLKSELEEEIDERRKADAYYGDGEKYTRLFEKYESLVAQLSQFRQNEADSTMEVERKYMEEIHELKNAHERDVTGLKEKAKHLQSTVDGDYSNALIENIEQDVPEIISELKKEGLFLPGETGKELLTRLFRKYQHMFKEFESSKDLISDFENDDIKKIVQVLKEERKVLKQCLDDSNKKIKSIENDLRIKETVFKNQINDLLVEKKKSHLALQKAVDEIDIIKDEKKELVDELENKKHFVDRKIKELDEFRENLLQATSDMKTIDAEHVRTKRELAMKDAEINRITQDYMNEQIQLQKVQKVSKQFEKDLEEKANELKCSEKEMAVLQEKVFDLEAELESYKSQHKRLVEEKDILLTGSNDLKKELFEVKSELRKSDGDIEALKVQNGALEASTRDKIKLITNTSSELDNVSVELLALKHLLTEEETKCKQYEEDIEKLTTELENQNHVLLSMQEANKETEQELNEYKDRFKRIEHDYEDSESVLYQCQQSKSELEKVHNKLKKDHTNLLDENKKLHERLGRLEDNISNEHELTKDWQDKYDTFRKETNKKNDEIIQIKMERDKVYQDNQVLQAKIDKLEENISANQLNLNEMINKVNDLNRNIINLTDEVDDKDEEINELKSEKEMMSLELTNATSHIEMLKKQVSDTEAVINEIEEPMEEAVVVNNLESGVDIFDEYFQDNKDTNKDDKDNNRWKLLSQTENVISRLKNTEQQLQDLKKENENLKEKMVENQKVFDEEILQKQVDILIEATNNIVANNKIEKEDGEKRNKDWNEEQANQRWKELLLKEHQIEKLNTQLDLKNTNIEVLEKQLDSLEEKIKFLDDSTIKHSTPKKEYKTLEKQVCDERKERIEAVECLKAVVEDNDKLTALLMKQQMKVERKERENNKLKNRINQLIATVDEKQRNINEMREQMKTPDTSSIDSSGHINSQQQKEIEYLQNDLNEARAEKRSLQLTLDDKKMELNRAEDEVRSLKNAMEYNLGCLQAEKRSKDLIEEQIGLIVQDRSSCSQKLQSTELQNKLLLAKLKSLQKWHGELQVSLIRSSSSSTSPNNGHIVTDYFMKDADNLQERNIFKETKMKTSPLKHFHVESDRKIGFKI